MTSGVGSHRPTMIGRTHAVSAGHYLATAAGYRILEQGGNAIDAGVAAGIALNVVLPQDTSFGGVAPILIHDARQGGLVSISGLGRWPRRATLEHYLDHRGGQIPEGVERVVVPAAPDAWLTALMEHGTMSFEQVVQPALEYARDGIAVGAALADAFKSYADRERQWPTLVAAFAPSGRFPGVGERFVQPALARTFERLIEVECRAVRLGRTAALNATRDFFYTGEIAEEIVAFVESGGGFLSMDDMSEFHVGHEPPVVGRFRDLELYASGPWCQGPVFAETAQILAEDDLESLGHNTADYVHLVAEGLKLGFSDRDAFYGDPDVVDVPIRGLLSTDYARSRRLEIDPANAWPAMPPPGDPWPFESRRRPEGYAYQPPAAMRGTTGSDTSYVCVVDRWGNVFSATPSDPNSAIVPSLGFTPSTRGSQSWLDPGHPSALAPWKRPRLTPMGLMAFKEGKPIMVFGTPGGDAQVQATLQFFLNTTVFGMTLQEAAEAPRFLSWSFPDSFWPHAYTPGRLELEGGIGTEVGEELGRRGHHVEWLATYGGLAKAVCAIAIDHATGALSAAADPRREAYALAR